MLDDAVAVRLGVDGVDANVAGRDLVGPLDRFMPAPARLPGDPLQLGAAIRGGGRGGEGDESERKHRRTIGSTA